MICKSLYTVFNSHLTWFTKLIVIDYNINLKIINQFENKQNMETLIDLTGPKILIVHSVSVSNLIICAKVSNVNLMI